MKSTEQHLLDGTFRGHRHSLRAENVAETVEQIPVPKDLDEVLRPKFLEVAALVADLGILTRADSDAIQQYVQALHLKELAFEEVQGGLFTSEGVNPAFRLFLQADAVLKPLRDALGLNPKARQTLKTKKAISKKLDPLAALFGKQ